MMMLNFCLVCKTVTKGDHCVFPFYYNGTKHYECITHDNNGTPWCSVDNGKKDNCSSDCPGRIVLTIECYHDYDQPLLS